MTQTLAPATASPASPGRTPVRRSRRRRHWREEAVAYLLLAPALITFFAFLAIPLVLTFGLSLVNWSGITLDSIEWAGFANYTRLLHDPIFWASLGHNLIFLVLGTSAIVGFGLFLAVLLEQGLPGSKFFRGVFFLPTVLSLVVIGIVFSFLLDPTFGVLKPILSAVGVQANPAPLADPGQVLYVLILLEAWRAFGFSMFLFVAGLKALDAHLTEAARIDGASAWQIFWKVTLPQLRPVTLMVATLVGIGTLRLFDIVYVMTNGGPDHASEVLNTYSYGEAFTYSYIGYGSTIAVVMLFITFLFTILRFKALPDERREARATR